MSAADDRPEGAQRALSAGANERRGAAAVDWALGEGAKADILEGVARGLARQRRRRRAVAAVAAILLIGGLSWHLAPTTSEVTPRGQVVVTRPTERTLPDGSRVELADRAEFETAFTAAERRITLRRGAAHFTVRPDPARPFVVVAGSVVTRAIGTAFAVTLGESGVEVLVTEGRVSVARQAPSEVGPDKGAASLASPALVVAGEKAICEGASSAVSVSTASPQQLEHELAWRAPLLDFSAAPLADAVALFNAHGSTPVVLGAPELGHLKISGVLRANNRAGLLLMLQLQFGLRAETRADGTVVVLPSGP